MADAQLPVDDNWSENQIRPIAISHNKWLFAGCMCTEQQAAAVMSPIQSALMDGHDPHAYLKAVLTRLPTHTANHIDELLPHRVARRHLIIRQNRINMGPPRAYRGPPLASAGTLS